MTCNTVKERPILFSVPMVRAIIEGRKTVTRRALKPQPPECTASVEWHADPDLGTSSWWECDSEGFSGDSALRGQCPYGVPGNRLWVREAWAWSGTDKKRTPSDPWYRATHYKGEDFGIRWRPSIHMPRWASRLTLEVTDVAVQRLQDMTEDDAIREGCDSGSDDGPLGEFSRLWDSINGPGAFAQNPWIWVVSFKVVEGNK